ncbi:glycylpeptide N-tetradecanoyltransferase [Nematocida major]|uniref:glycylpeptide N-tetradecanoyltransferase n=1 Tax=Nematocida major TaxID=1912982 RepID=UPI002008A795|nr:glycylpeptide N-tetradecanoyltransferase [Nematocida major]KAH9385532.1 glycylpeptide N-tetradecanoyltransferase [Nematocida major]
MSEEGKRSSSEIEKNDKIKERTREEKNRTAYKVVNEVLLKEHAFWSKEPLGKSQASCKGSGSSSAEGAAGLDIRTVDIACELSAVASFLMDHYVEDAEARFRLQYSPEFLRWQLESPSVFPEWNIGMFDGSRLVGFISAAAIDIKIKESTPKTAVVNFLCVHKDYRKRRLAPVLIKEITKRVNLKGIYTALFTSGDKLPYIFTRSRYYHKILREGDLVESGFCDQEDIDKITESRMIFQDSPTVHFRPAQESELPGVYEMYCSKYKDLDISASFTYEQFKYYVYGDGRGLSRLLVSEDASEFVSFFHLSTRSVDSKVPIETAYLSYHTMKHGVGSMLGLIQYLRGTDEFDVLNALEIESNTQSIFADSGFIKGDGTINYYLFNWDTELIPPSRNSFISY